MASESDQKPEHLSVRLGGGPPRICIDDRTDVGPRSRRASALIAYLALAPGHGATRDRLADLLWGQRGPEQARASLRQCLLELRALAPGIGWLCADRTRVWLAAQQVTVDLIGSIARLRSAEDGAEAIAALAALPAPARMLDDLNAGPDVDQWVLEARATLERDLRHALDAQVARRLAAGDSRAALALADGFLAHTPDDEEVSVIAMRAELALGEGAAALRRFERLKATLARELGCAPGSAAARLRDEIVAGRVPAPASAPAAIASAPPPATDGPPLVIVPAFDEREAGEGSRAVALREEILAGLARFRDIRLSSRAAPLRPDELVAPEAERAYALTVTLHGRAADARLVARVARVSDDEVVWAETLDLAALGAAGGVATVVRRVIAAVLPAVAGHFFRRLEGRASGPYDAYLVARHRSIHARRPEEIAAAAQELEAIVAARPDFAPAHAPLVRLLNTDRFYSALGSTGRAERARALELARTAVTLDPQDAQNHAVLGWCHLWHGQEVLARKRLDRVLELNPYNVVRLYEVATGLVYLGDFAASRDILARCGALGLGHSEAYHEDLGRLFVAERRYDEALAEFDLLLERQITTSLYAAVAATMAGSAGAAEQAGAWRRTFAARWCGDGAPDERAMIGWAEFHHPFVAGLKPAFMAGVQAMLALSTAG